MNNRPSNVFELATNLSYRRLGQVELPVRAVRGSTVCVLVSGFSKRVGTKTVTLAAGTYLVPDWRHGGKKPDHMVFDNAYSAKRGLSNAMDTERAKFAEVASRAARYLISFPKMTERRRRNMKRRCDHAVAKSVGIMNNLAIWKSAIEAELIAAQAVIGEWKKAFDVSLADSERQCPDQDHFYRQEQNSLGSRPFISIGLLLGDLPPPPMVSDSLSGYLRAHELELLDADLSRAESLLTRRRTMRSYLVGVTLIIMRTRCDHIMRTVSGQDVFGKCLVSVFAIIGRSISEFALDGPRAALHSVCEARKELKSLLPDWPSV